MRLAYFEITLNVSYLPSLTCNRTIQSLDHRADIRSLLMTSKVKYEHDLILISTFPNHQFFGRAAVTFDSP